MSAWLTTEEVAQQLGVIPDPELLATVTDSAATWVERVRPEYLDDLGGYTPPADIRQGAVLEACEQYNRRGTSTAPPEYADMGAGYQPLNPLTFRLLRLGRWADPVVS